MDDLDLKLHRLQLEVEEVQEARRRRQNMSAEEIVSCNKRTVMTRDMELPKKLPPDDTPALAVMKSKPQCHDLIWKGATSPERQGDFDRVNPVRQAKR